MLITHTGEDLAARVRSDLKWREALTCRDEDRARVFW